MIEIDSKVEFYLRDGNFATNDGILNLHPGKRTHWVCYFKDCSFDSYGCLPPKMVPNFIKSKHGNFIYSEYQIQKN